MVRRSNEKLQGSNNEQAELMKRRLQNEDAQHVRALPAELRGVCVCVLSEVVIFLK